MDIFERLEWIPLELRDEESSGARVIYRRATASELTAYRLGTEALEAKRRAKWKDLYGLDNDALDALYQEAALTVEFEKVEDEVEVRGEDGTVTKKKVTKLGDLVQDPANLDRWDRRVKAQYKLNRLSGALGEAELRPYLDIALACVVSIEGFTAGGTRLEWDDERLSSLGASKELLLTSIGSSAFMREQNLKDLASACITGLGARLGKSESTSSEG